MHRDSHTNPDSHVLCTDMVAESECTLTHTGTVLNTHTDSKMHIVT